MVHNNICFGREFKYQPKYKYQVSPLSFLSMCVISYVTSNQHRHQVRKSNNKINLELFLLYWKDEMMLGVCHAQK